MINKASIHIRLILAAFVLISASILAFFAGINMLSRFIQARYDEKIDFMAGYLSLNAELGILIDDRLMLAGLARNLLTQQDVVRVVISNKKGDILADEAARSLAGFPHGKTLYQVSAPVKIKENKDETLAFSGRTGLRGDNLIGQVKIYYSVDGINGMLKEIRNKFYLLSAALVSVSLVMFILLSHYLVKPVRQLVLAARQVAQGDLDLRVSPGNLPETRELAEAFNAMLNSLSHSNKQLEKASQEMVRQKTLAEMGKFSLMIAHEVKNPLGIIKCSLDVLKQDLQISSENTMVHFIEDEIERMNRMIEDYLEFARPASPACREVDPNLLMRDCVARFELQTKELPAHFHLDLPEESCLLHIDPDLMTRVFSNIIKNALEITQGKGMIVIRAANGPDEWTCSIIDEGPGIAADDINKIFEPFFTTRTKGSGLGLALVAQVIKDHNGRVNVKNMDKGGACFTVSLPKKMPVNPEQMKDEALG